VVQSFLVNFSNTIEVALEHFEKTRLDRDLDVLYGPESEERKLYHDVERTYLKYLYKFCTEDITIITSKLIAQTYRFANFTVTIKNIWGLDHVSG